MLVFSFPNPVNEYAARIVAAGVLVMAVAAIAFQQPWILIPLTYGFIARVLTGPTLSPLGQLATRVIAPRLGPAKLVAGPPKRFAQAIGAVVTTTILVLVAFGVSILAQALLVVMIVFATLESVFALCVGCKIFN